MNGEMFKTPQTRRIRSLVKEGNEVKGSPSRQITVPSSPCLERLGYGTGVNVYLMERTPMKGVYRSPWAVKKVAKRFAVNPEQHDFSQRLLKEAEILRTLNHPNIIGYRTLTKAVDGAWCLAMEKAEHCLMDMIEERMDSSDPKPFPPELIERVGLDVANALAYLHGEKLLMHGDLKSGNILVFDNFKLIKLCDFGVTLPLKKANGKVKSGHFYVGTRAWCAPEIISIEESFDTESEAVITCKADIFSYGLTLWEMLSLCLPHADLLGDGEDEEDEEENEAAYQEALGTRPPLPYLPQGYEKIVAVFIATTAPNPTRRPQATEIINIFSDLSTISQ